MTELFNNPRTIALIFSLLGRGKAILEDSKISGCEVFSACSSCRQRLFNRLHSRYTCTITEEGRLWTRIDSVPKSTSTTISPTAEKSGKFGKLSPFRVGPGTTIPSGNPFVQMPDLATPTLSVPREVPFPPNETKAVKKIVIKKKSSGGK